MVGRRDEKSSRKRPFNEFDEVHECWSYQINQTAKTLTLICVRNNSTTTAAAANTTTIIVAAAAAVACWQLPMSEQNKPKKFGERWAEFRIPTRFLITRTGRKGTERSGRLHNTKTEQKNEKKRRTNSPTGRRAQEAEGSETLQLVPKTAIAEPTYIDGSRTLHWTHISFRFLRRKEREKLILPSSAFDNNRSHDVAQNQSQPMMREVPAY